MITFPKKIILSQDKETLEVDGYWVLQDFTDNITKEYVRLDTVVNFLKENLILEEDYPHSTDTLINNLIKEIEKPIYE